MQAIIAFIKAKPQVIGLLLTLVTQILFALHVIIPPEIIQTLLDIATLVFGGVTAYKSAQNSLI